MTTTFDASACQRCLSLWNGSSNNPLPSNFADVGFDDSAWPAPVPTVPQIPSMGIWPSYPPLAHTEQAVFRHHFTLAADVISATIQVMGDDNIDGVFLNGGSTNVGGNISSGGNVQQLPASGFNVSGDNVLTIIGRNADPPGTTGGACVAYLVTITTSADIAPAGSGTSPPPYGGGTGGQLADCVRLVHRNGLVCWEHDSTRLRVLSAGEGVLETPFARLSSAPGQFVGRDPLTGLPAYCPPPNVVQQIVNNYTVITSEQNQQPATTCVQVRCGAALGLITEFKIWYANVIGWLRAVLLWLGVGVASFVIDTISAFIDLITDGAGLVLSPLETALVRLVVRALPGVTGGALQAFCAAGLSATALDDMTKAAFCALACSNNQIALDQRQMLAWQSAVAALPGADFSGIQQQVCGAILLWAARFPEALTAWAQAAQTGVAYPSTNCDSWACP